MRSNQAGETGAVAIYHGSGWALGVRERWLGMGGGYEAALASFVREHVESERAHLVLLDVILCDASMRSRLLPVWRLAGFALGAVSTLLSPRRMYVTTDAVETFVEGHYQYQIGRLEGAKEGTSRVEGRAETEALPHDTAVESHDYHDDRGREELLRVLRHCCEDEVHHKEEAQAAYGTLRFTDVPWQWLVGRGSAAAASAAKLL
jgi:ubiquinone biosynthesis monooxygenase Coq7